MDFRKLLFGTLCCFALATSFLSCSDDDGPQFNDEGSKVELPGRRAFILYEGANVTSNNAGIAFYAPDGNAQFVKNIYYTQNEKQLGSLGLSMVEYENNLYVVVSGSKYISKLNSACVEEGRYVIPAGEGDPRFIEAEDGFLYVTQYGGQVSKIDTRTLERVLTFKGGDNLEGIVECNGKLYVANTYKGVYPNIVYNKEVLVINPQDMTLVQTISVPDNPERLFEENGKVYLYSKGNYADVPNTLSIIDPAQNNNVTDLKIRASKVAEGNDDLFYLVNNVTEYNENWQPVSSVNSFITYNTKTGQKGGSFLKNVPEKLKSANIYLLAVDDETGDIYVGTTDYVTTGTIYRFDRNGNQKGEPFDAGGINPNTMLFLD